MIPFVPLLAGAGSAVGKVLRSIPWQAWVLAGAFLLGWVIAETAADQREAEVRAEYELNAAKEADQVAQFLAEETERNRNREQALNDQLHQAAIDHAHALNDLEARTGRTLADLRAGEQRVRQQWRACLGRLPGAGPTAEAGPGDDGAADDGNASAGRILRIAGECDAAVKRWQTTWEKAVQAVNAQGSGG